MGNPKSATIFYLKSQDPSGADQTYKYDTKMFVDGEEIKPVLTRATDARGTNQFIDKFGQKTTLPPDPAFILEGKGSALYKADDLGAPKASTAALLSGRGVQTHLGDGKTIEIVTDPMQFKSTVEGHATNSPATTPPAGSPFWGKEFLLVDVDGSGPVSIDIPPGTYNGIQLAATVENAMRDAFGDDKKVKLTADVDNKFTIDLKKLEGDGKAKGLLVPIEIDLHTETIVADASEAVAGLKIPELLTHAQILVTEKLNAYAQDTASTQRVVAARVTDMGIDGRMFKKAEGLEITNPIALPTAYDWIEVTSRNNHIKATDNVLNTGGTAGGNIKRFIAYSKINNQPEVSVYDYKMAQPADTKFTKNADGYLVLTLPTANIIEKPEVFRFQQNDVNNKTENFIAEIGSNEIAVKSVTTDTVNNEYSFVLDHKVVLDAKMLTPNTGGEAPITILAKRSDHIEAYFEDTKGMVEGVDDVFYANRMIVREIGDSAKREVSTAGGGVNTDGVIAFGATSSDDTTLTTYGLNTVAITTEWIDERSPSFKIGYDETNQSLTFDGINTALGKGTGVGFDTFTVYSDKLDSGTNGLGIHAFGDNPDISLTLDEILTGKPFVPTGPDVRPQNKRYGMNVEFDTVANNFNFFSGTTGEALAANSVVGVNKAQSASSISVGRYNLTAAGIKDPTDNADYAFNKIGKGTNNVMGLPRDGVEGYTGPTGLVSKAAVSIGGEALMDMTKPFTVSSLANENKFTVVSNGVSALITVPEGNYKGDTLAQALESRINNMVNPVSGEAVGGVNVVYDGIKNNFTFTTSTAGEGSLFSINGALRFGLNDVPLGLGETAQVRTPVQAKDSLGRPLFISPTGEITANNQAFASNMVQDFYPLYLDEGELTFGINGEIISPVNKIKYTGFPSKELTVDFSSATSFDQPFSATNVTQDGFTKGRLTNLEIDNYGNVQTGYSNGQNVVLGKIIVASFANQSGLKQIGNSTFIETASSGAVELGQASEDGFGQILSGSLERSNVDITEELVNLITSQRNYQAAAKAIETSTSMTQTIINIRN
jgi:flagellar hook protein FlgE